MKNDIQSVSNKLVKAYNNNKLITPIPEYSFPGLKSGDKWCLCVLRWKGGFRK